MSNSEVTSDDVQDRESYAEPNESKKMEEEPAKSVDIIKQEVEQQVVDSENSEALIPDVDG